MKIFIFFFVLSIDFSLASISQKYLLGPIAYFNNYWINFPKNMTDLKLRGLFTEQFCEVSNKILSVTYPPKLIWHFYNLEERYFQFIIFFWANILTIPFEARICHVDYIDGGNGFAWRKAVISLLSYTRENLLVLKEVDKKRFLNLVLKFYHKKFRLNFKKSQRDPAKFHTIDRKFYQLLSSLNTRMHEYTPPADIHLALFNAHRDFRCQLVKLGQKHKVKLFYLIRYFRVATSEYCLLTWLIKQPVVFIKDFLLLNICFTIDPDVPIKIPIMKSLLNAFYISLRRIVPIFDVDFKTNKVRIIMKKADIYDRLPCLREVDLFDLTRLLNRFFLKLSNYVKQNPS
jgi:hypothetical protein